MSEAPQIDNSFDLDLDTLAQSKKRVKINGQIIEFNPPSLEDLIDLAKLGGQLQKMQHPNQEADVDNMSDVMEKLKVGLQNIVPELKDHKLNMNQLMALVNLFVDAAQPNDVKELQKRGISMDSDQKKTVSD